MQQLLQTIAAIIVSPMILVLSWAGYDLNHTVTTDAPSYQQFLDLEESVNQLAEDLDGNLGASIPVPIANFQTSLVSSISSSDTSMSLVSTSTDDGTGLQVGTIYGFTIDEGTSNQEYVLGTGGANQTIVSMTRGISTLTGNTNIAALQKAHRRGASVKITDAPVLLVLARIINGDETFPNILSYNSHPTFSSDEDIIDKKYADDLAIAGAPDASVTVKGIFEVGTAAEIASGAAAGSGDTSAYLAITTDKATSTPDGTSYSANKVVVSEADGKLNQLWLDLSEGWDLSGGITMDQATSSEMVIGNTVPSSELGTGDLYVGNDLTVEGNFLLNGSLNYSGTHYYGDGQDGAKTITSATKINTASSTIDALTSSAQTTINVADTTGFATSSKALLWQVQGTGAGLWEIIDIADLNNDSGTLTAAENIKNSYQATGAQVIRIPEYTTVDVKTGGSFTVDDWEGTHGGIVIFYASQGVTIESDVTISLNGKGFRGGAGSTQGESEDGVGSVAVTPNGMGGGGGGNGVSSQGGLSFIDANSSYRTGTTNSLKLLFGGGGGGGYSSILGGDSGGILIIITPYIWNAGTVTSNGNNGANESSSDGGGGGGAGGTIWFLADRVFNLTTPTVTAGNGGTGSVQRGGSGGGYTSTASNAGVGNGTAGKAGFYWQGYLEDVLPYN